MIAQEIQPTMAMVAAERNYAANVLALQRRQPALAQEVAAASADVEWVFGRDGSLTARQDGGWWSGCSLPRRAAEALLEKMALNATVTCFLSPTHAAQLRVTLDRIGSGRALIAVVPEISDLRLMLACECFSQEIEAGRLWFAWGERWETELERLLGENDGLPTPGQFVRTTLVEVQQIEVMIAAAQKVFSREIGRRAEIGRALLQSEAPIERDRVCVVASGAFRFWDDAGYVLASIAREQAWGVIDPDDPCQASPLALARAAAGCGALMVVNVGRADLPELPAAMKIISWVTGPRLPRFVPGNAADQLVVVDERWRRMAITAGWPADRVAVATWPLEKREHGGRGLGVIVDTLPMTAPVFELSSQKVLWDSIARELSDDPFAVGQDVEGYLARWLRRAGIAEETVNRDWFIERLILPAYAQGLVRWLLLADVKVKLFGRGWGEIDEFAAHCAGEVSDREALRAAVEGCGALVHVWPANWAHAMDSAGRRVLRRGSKNKEMWISEAKQLARGEAHTPPVNGPELTADLLRRAAGLA